MFEFYCSENFQGTLAEARAARRGAMKAIWRKTVDGLRPRAGGIVTR